MYFDFEGRNVDTPTVESAVSWREQVLVSLFVHVLAVLLVLFAPRLEFFRELAERRAERIAELTRERAALAAEAADQLALAQPSRDNTFVFIAPRVDREADEAPRENAPLSDQDRIAQSPERVFDSDSRLPIAEGNSSRFVESDLPDEPVDPQAPLELENEPEDGQRGDELGKDEGDETQLADATAGDGETSEVVDDLSDDPGTRADGSGLAGIPESLLKTPGTGPGDPDDPDRRPNIVADGLLGKTSRALNRSIRRESFANLSGDSGHFGDLQFDSKGVEFGPWVRRFKAQVYRNWFWPYRVITDHGHVVLTFIVHKNGSLTGVQVMKQSLPSFNRSASNALNMSNPTVPLPDEYPEAEMRVTATFYFNEVPPQALP